MTRRGFGDKIEKRGIAIREWAGVELELPLNPFILADLLGITVIEPKDVADISEVDINQLLWFDPYSWSGVSFVTTTGKVVVILNPTHSKGRNNATLMEEICHIVLKHKPTVLKIYNDFEVAFRNFNKQQEREAYAVGAAALVPRKPLLLAIKDKRSAEEIAKQYNVTRDLVEFRIKVNGFWGMYRAY